MGLEAGVVGFEPTSVLPPLVFKTSAFVRSAIPPRAHYTTPGIRARSALLGLRLSARRPGFDSGDLSACPLRGLISTLGPLEGPHLSAPRLPAVGGFSAFQVIVMALPRSWRA